jgi:hypothetical protein
MNGWWWLVGTRPTCWHTALSWNGCRHERAAVTGTACENDMGGRGAMDMCEQMSMHEQTHGWARRDPRTLCVALCSISPLETNK